MSGELAHLNPSTWGVDFIVSYVEENGWPPTVREIGAAVGLDSPATVHSHLDTLVREGRIFRDPTKPRAIRVVTGDPA